MGPLRRRPRRDPPRAYAPQVPWDLLSLVRLGPAPLSPRERSWDGPLAVALVTGPGRAETGVPGELLAALHERAIHVRPVTDWGAPDVVSEVDVVLAAGWPAAPGVLTLQGARARAVVATADEPDLPELGWMDDITVLGPTWMGGALPTGADAAYRLLPMHRRDDLVLVHGEDAFGLLAVQELLERGAEVEVVVSGLPPESQLPFPFKGVAPGSATLAEAFALATVGVAPRVRGWRPAALAMMACGLPVVAPDDAAARAALGSAAELAPDPLAAATGLEVLLEDLALRAQLARAGMAVAGGGSGWGATADALAHVLLTL